MFKNILSVPGTGNFQASIQRDAEPHAAGEDWPNAKTQVQK